MNFYQAKFRVFHKMRHWFAGPWERNGIWSDAFTLATETLAFWGDIGYDGSI